MDGARDSHGTRALLTVMRTCATTIPQQNATSFARFSELKRFAKIAASAKPMMATIAGRYVR